MKNPMTMTRSQIIDELRAHTSKRQLDAILWETTAHLRSKLAFVLSPETDKQDTRKEAQLALSEIRKHAAIREITERIRRGDIRMLSNVSGRFMPKGTLVMGIDCGYGYGADFAIRPKPAYNFPSSRLPKKRKKFLGIL